MGITNLLGLARDAITAKFGTPTVLVNGAGGNKPEGTVGPGGDFCEMSLDGWNAVFDLNLVGGTLLPCQIFGKQMVAAGKGRWVTDACATERRPARCARARPLSVMSIPIARP